MINHHAALIYTMVLVSASDRDMSDAELATMGKIVNQLPAFDEFDENDLPQVTRECAAALQRPDGLNHTLDLVLAGLPEHLRETAYAIACDIAAADGQVVMEEIRVLQLLRQHLMIDRLSAAAIERGAAARHRRA